METIDRLLEALDPFDPTMGTLARLRSMIVYPTTRSAVEVLIMSYVGERVDALMEEDPDFDELMKDQPGVGQIRVLLHGSTRTVEAYLVSYAMALSYTSYRWAPWRRVYEAMLPELEFTGA